MGRGASVAGLEWRGGGAARARSPRRSGRLSLCLRRTVDDAISSSLLSVVIPLVWLPLIPREDAPTAASSGTIPA